MNNGKLSKTDVKYNKIYLDESTCALFKPFVNQKIKIVDEDDCEFFFDVNWRFSNRKNKLSLVLSQTKDFIIQWDLKEGDVLSFKYNSDICTFTVDIMKSGNSQVLNGTSCSYPDITPIDEDSKIKLLKIIAQTYQSVVDEYRNTFIENSYLPTKVARSSIAINGFTERNLTFNFCHSYLKHNSNTIVWQEIPITSVNRQHVDSIIIDNDWIIYIEAKRLYDITHFELLLKDLERIKEFHTGIPIPPGPTKNKAIVLLADHYFNGESKKKKDKDEIYDLFFSGQNVNVEPEIIKDFPRLADISSAKIRKVDIKEPSIEIPRENNYNISVWDDLVYTIYCGVYFLGEIEKA